MVAWQRGDTHTHANTVYIHTHTPKHESGHSLKPWDADVARCGTVR